MKLRVAKKVMARYFRTGIRPREDTFTKAFLRTKLPGSRCVRPFNIGKSLDKLGKLYGPPVFVDPLIIMKALDKLYKHCMERLKP